MSQQDVATIENASREHELEATQGQGSAKSVNPRQQATQTNANLHDRDVLEQRVFEHDTMHPLPQDDTIPKQKNSSNPPSNIPIPKLPERRTTPKPEFDPFERLLKPMLEQDTIQCSAWKDEVQNILIFAGLFSAVVTAFIIESYQRLQPDPNDTIVGLLAHIAEKLDNPSINGTASVSSLVSDANFSPSRSDININVFWFMSLVLSLTAALIGIITLQWLREHQRYDNMLKPQEMMAILHARLQSFEAWYVPEIFAGLPLLLQAALALFFAGMIEFLFVLRPQVAVPVTLAICIPLIFLMATTLLPLLQVCLLQYPFRFSINDNVPSPCPYKSPQSLIFHRIGVQSKFVFKLFATIVAGVYACIVEIICFVRRLAGSPPPVFRLQQPYLWNRKYNRYLENIRSICKVRGAHWTSFDMSWLSSRAVHAILLQQAKNRNNNSRATYWRINTMYTFPPEVYDCSRCLRRVVDQHRTGADFYALHHCVEALFSHAMDTFQEWCQQVSTMPNIVESETAGFYFTFAQLLYDIYDLGHYPLNPLVTAAFIKDAISHESPDNSEVTVETLCAAFMAYRAENMPRSGSLSVVPAVPTIAKDGASLLIMNRLKISPEKLFAMSSGDVWLPAILRYSTYLREDLLLAPSITHLFRAFLKRCLTMQPSSQLALRPVPAYEAYGGIAAYMDLIVHYQTNDAIADALAHLTELCSLHTPLDLMHEKPFLMIAACFYLDAVFSWRYRGFMASSDDDDGLHFLDNYRPLLNIIVQACGIGEGSIHLSSGWSELDEAIYAIYNYHNPSYPSQPRYSSSGSISLTNPNSRDNIQVV